IYLSGDFYEDMDADPGPDVSMIYAEGGISIFIISLDSAGKFRWARSIPDAGTGLIDAMAVDKSGNVYLSDQYKSGADMDPGPGVTILDSLFNVGNYLLKMDANGDFIWCKTIGQSKRFEPYLTVITRCLHAAPDESIYFTCSYMGDTLDLDPGAGVYQVTGTSDDYNGALVKINPNGDLLWACHTNSIGNYKAVTTDLNGNVYAVGDFEDWMDFDPGKGVFKLDAGYRSDSFLQKLDAEGNLIWVKNTGIDIIFNTTFLSTDMDKGVWIAGNFFNNIYCINEGQKIVLSSIGDQDIFVQYIDKQGNVKLLKNIGSAATDAIESMATDLEGNLYVSGRVDGLADIDFGGTYHTIDSNSPALFVGQWRPGQKIESKPLPLILTPNPTSGLLTLDLNAPPQDVRINIWNATGQFMSSRVYHDAALFQFELEGNPGLYFVQVVLEDGTTVVEKVVKGL
ncbi:MAG: T9SS type A sorting domain-containing protein, partial [Bacteroidota bacterium]